MRKSITAAAKSVDATNYDLFDLCIYMREAYERAFTRENILSAFARTGINPSGAGDLLCVPRPVSKSAPSTMISVEDLTSLLEDKICSMRRGMLLQVPVLRREFVDTSLDLHLTSEAAMTMVRGKEALERAKKARKSLRKSTQEQKWLHLYESKRRKRIQLELDALHYRVHLYGEPFKLPCSMKERRLFAQQRAQKTRVASLEKRGE